MIRFILPALAQQPLMDGITGKCDTPSGCSPNDLVQVGIKATGIIFGVIGSVALLFFFYGGLVYLTAAGSKERVKKGTDIIKNAALGMLVVFLSYTVVGFVFWAFGIPGWQNFATSTWLPSPP
jgi:hypothetical protein